MTYKMVYKQTYKRIQTFKKHLKSNKIERSENNYKATNSRKKDKDIFNIKVKVHFLQFIYIYIYIL